MFKREQRLSDFNNKVTEPTDQQYTSVVLSGGIIEFEDDDLISALSRSDIPSDFMSRPLSQINRSTSREHSKKRGKVKEELLRLREEFGKTEKENRELKDIIRTIRDSTNQS